MTINPTMARLGVVSAITHLMAKAEIGMMHPHTAETVLQSCLLELQAYGFNGFLLRKIEAECRHQYPDEVPIMKALFDRLDRLEKEGNFNPKTDMIRTESHAGSSVTIADAIMGRCMQLQKALDMPIGVVKQTAASKQKSK